MAQLILTMGPPGCGKNTWARERAKKSKAGCTIVNRDDLRQMVVGGQLQDYKFNKHTEKHITKAQFHMAELAVAQGRDVIVADTNLNPKTITKWEEFAKLHNMNVEKMDFFKEFRKTGRAMQAFGHDGMSGVVDAFRKQTHERNLKRLNSVPPSVVDNFIDTYIKPQYVRIRQHLHIDGLPKAVLFDIDGTLAHHNDERHPCAWHLVGKDTPDEHVIETLNMYRLAGYTIIVMSGRDSVCRPETEQWLFQQGIQYDHLFMRAKDDCRKDSIIKEELFFNNVDGNFNVRVIFDDRDQVVTRWREMGLKVYQVEPGAF